MFPFGISSPVFSSPANFLRWLYRFVIQVESACNQDNRKAYTTANKCFEPWKISFLWSGWVVRSWWTANNFSRKRRSYLKRRDGSTFAFEARTNFVKFARRFLHAIGFLHMVIRTRVGCFFLSVCVRHTRQPTNVRIITFEKLICISTRRYAKAVRLSVKKSNWKWRESVGSAFPLRHLIRIHFIHNFSIQFTLFIRQFDVIRTFGAKITAKCS